ncbi:hypothetical protein SAMN04489812_1637 [Microlunatus soli]|uniref:Uncharacterized protein n=1 Tax=Microlunatus soli TaxID=630515 RepID=A0A1H1RG77_9ACTN|nr:hypothetical protein SAMN04489812_1637 [Microlunatus soli]
MLLNKTSLSHSPTGENHHGEQATARPDRDRGLRDRVGLHADGRPWRDGAGVPGDSAADRDRDRPHRPGQRCRLVRHRRDVRQGAVRARAQHGTDRAGCPVRERSDRQQVDSGRADRGEHRPDHRRPAGRPAGISARPASDPFSGQLLRRRRADRRDGRVGRLRPDRCHRCQQLQRPPVGARPGQGPFARTGGGQQPGADQPAASRHRDQRRARHGASSGDHVDRLRTVAAGHPDRPVPCRPGGAAGAAADPADHDRR